MSLLLLLDDGPSPAFSANFMSGVLPAGLTYTNSSTERTYFGSDGLLKTAVANAPIFEYNPVTLALLGMRWEMEQRTNSCTYSSEDNAAWISSNTTKSAATSIIPGKSATLCTATMAGGYIYNSVGAFSGAAEVASCIIEKGTGAESNLLIYNSTTTAVVANAKLVWSTLTASLASGAGTVSVTELKTAGPNGGRTALLSVTYTGTGGNSRIIRYYPAGSGSGTGYRHHTQQESGASSSSIIVTTAAAVTRQPDVLTATSISPWYRQDEGTVLFEGIASIIGASNGGIYVFTDGTFGNRIYSVITSVGLLNFGIVASGTTQVSVITANAASSGSIFRSAAAYKINDFATVLNFGTVVTDAIGTTPTVDQLKLGAAASPGNSPFMGYARRFSYYNSRLPNAQIQGMSRV